MISASTPTIAAGQREPGGSTHITASATMPNASTPMLAVINRSRWGNSRRYGPSRPRSAGITRCSCHPISPISRTRVMIPAQTATIPFSSNANRPAANSTTHTHTNSRATAAAIARSILWTATSSRTSLAAACAK